MVDPYLCLERLAPRLLPGFLGGLMLLAACQGLSPTLPIAGELAPALDLASLTAEARQVLLSIPAPAEVAASLKRSQAYFVEGRMTPTARADYQLTSGSQALAVGAYGADLAYCTLYRRPVQSLAYLRTVERLCMHLQVDQALQTGTLRRYMASYHGPDSVLGLANACFQRISTQLAARDQPELSYQMAVGGFVESLSLLCQASRSQQDTLLAERVGEQGIVLARLRGIGDKLSQAPAMAHTQAALAGLAMAYQDIETIEVPGQMRLVEVGGLPTYVSSARSRTPVSAAQLERIAEAALQARMILLSGS